MKILVTGANGLVGQHLVQRLVDHGHQVMATGRGPGRIDGGTRGYDYTDADITDERSIALLLEKAEPQIIIHSAAMTQVDHCEQLREDCTRTNVNATASLVSQAIKYQSTIICLSTDFVFDGIKGNYAEYDERKAVNHYGDTKILAENIVQQGGLSWAIVRTCLVYGNVLHGTRSNIIGWVRTNLEQRKNILVVDDQVRSPTFVEDLVDGILLIVEKKAKGIFHIAGKDILTPYAMSLQTADLFNLDKKHIGRADSSSFSQPARRPLITNMNIGKAISVLGYKPLSFPEGLKKMTGI